MSQKKSFRELLEQWNQKLADEGFNDIEYKTDSGRPTEYFTDRGASTSIYKTYNSQQEFYYYKAREFLHLLDFEDKFDSNAELYKQLWHLHAEGLSYRQISKYFKNTNDAKFSAYEKYYNGSNLDISYYWAFSHIQKILDYYWEWMLEQGYKDPRSRKSIVLKPRLRTSIIK